MPYAIPANVRYEERLIGPFNLKQSIYVVIGGGIILWAYLFSGLPFLYQIMIILVTGGVVVGVVMFNLDTMVVDYVMFFKAEKKTSWISPAARKLMDIKSIRADAVFLGDGKVLGLLKIVPINFGVLSEQDRDTVIYGFLEFLNSLNFPIQIVMRSVNLDLEDYLRHLKRRIVQRDDKIALAYYEHFAEYVRNYIKVNKINDRLFYIVVPAEKKPTVKATLENLDGRCETVVQTLALSGIVAERMNTKQLINLYSSYFTETFEILDTYVSPITIYKKMWHEAPKHPADYEEVLEEKLKGKGEV